MEIRVIPSELKKHINYLDEEIRISRRIEEMAETAFALMPNESEILQSVRRLNKSIRARRDILEHMTEALEDQEYWLRDYIDFLKRSQR